MHDRFPLPDLGFEPLAPFWEGASEHKLLMPYDVATQKIVWYPKPDDPSAGTKNKYEWREVSGRGNLFSWVVVHHAFLPQYKSALPFTTALVSLEEDPDVRLVTRLTNVSDTNKLEGDMALEVVFDKLSYEGVEGEDGNPVEIMAPFFQPV